MEGSGRLQNMSFIEIDEIRKKRGKTFYANVYGLEENGIFREIPMEGKRANFK